GQLNRRRILRGKPPVPTDHDAYAPTFPDPNVAADRYLDWLDVFLTNNKPEYSRFTLADRYRLHAIAVRLLFVLMLSGLLGILVWAVWDDSTHDPLKVRRLAGGRELQWQQQRLQADRPIVRQKPQARSSRAGRWARRASAP